MVDYKTLLIPESLMNPLVKNLSSRRLNDPKFARISDRHFLLSPLYRFFCLLAALVIGLSSCAPQSTRPPSPTRARPQTTRTEPAATESEPSLFRIGQRYSDA